MVAAPYATTLEEIRVGGTTWHIRRLVDRQQFHDPDGRDEAAGVVPAYWSLFGVTWEAGLMLADAVAGKDIEHRRILEIGAGLALPSLVLHRRGADITASDVHPLAEDFISENCARNALPPLPFRRLDWRSDDVEPGQFDLVIAADVLYEHDQVAPLARFVDRHCANEFLLADPGRGNINRFSRALGERGFTAATTATGKARLVSYTRSS